LLVTDRGPSALVWTGPGDALTGRLIGVMLLIIAAGAITSRPPAGIARLMLATAVVVGAELALAGGWTVLEGKPVNPDYVAVFGLIAVVSAALLAAERGRVPAEARGKGVPLK